MGWNTKEGKIILKKQQQQKRKISMNEERTVRMPINRKGTVKSRQGY